MGQAGPLPFQALGLAPAEWLRAVGMAFPTHGKNSFAQRLGLL